MNSTRISITTLNGPKLDKRPFWRKRPVFSTYIGCILALIFIMFMLFYHDYHSQQMYQHMDEHIHSEGHAHAHGVAHDALDKATDEEDVIEYDNDGTLHQHKQHNHGQLAKHVPIEDKPWGEIYNPIRVWCVVPTLWPKKKFVMEVRMMYLFVVLLVLCLYVVF